MAEYDVVMDQALGRLKSDGSRREFLRLAGLLGGAFALAACSDDDDTGTNPGGGGDGGTITLNFAQAADVLKYALALETLEADFYTRVGSNSGFSTAFPSQTERQVLTDIRDHEVAHREFLKAALVAAGATLPAVTPQFGTVSFGDRTSVLQTARTFEDLGVGAYNGAARYLTASASLPFLKVAGKIVSVEARHASAIRDLLQPNTSFFANVSQPTPLPGADESKGLDTLATPSVVIAAAAPFFVQTIRVTGT